MNLVEEITHNFKVQEKHDREVKETIKRGVEAVAERELDDKARHFSRLQLAKLHSAPPADKHALIEEMCAENKRRLTHQPEV